MEFQIRNWGCFVWLYGDNIVEQHVHNIDIANWVMAKDGDPKKAHPVEANGMGGRVNRGNYGDIFDHHFVEFTYADGTKVFSQCRHIAGTWDQSASSCTAPRAAATRPPAAGRSSKAATPTTRNTSTWSRRSRRQAAQRRLVRRHQQHDSRARPDGHLLGPSSEVGRSGGKGPAGISRADGVGRQAPSMPGENGLYPFPIPGVSPLF